MPAGPAYAVDTARGRAHAERRGNSTDSKTAEGLHIAYQVIGDAPIDVVLVRGYATHMDLSWERPGFRHIMDRLSHFARVILFDKAGTGLSDPVDDVPTLEERMDAVRAVMDAAGSDRAAIWGFSEGGAMSALFAATHPDRTTHLILYSSMGRTTWARDHPWAVPVDSLLESAREFLAPMWGRERTSRSGRRPLPVTRRLSSDEGKFERQAASPGMFNKLLRMFLDVDVRHVLPTIRVPTLVRHRRGDRVVNVANGRYVAEHVATAA